MITSGLAAGDKVVIDGVDRLRDGAKVKVVDHPAAGGAQAGAAAGRSGAVGSTNGGGHATDSATIGEAGPRRSEPMAPRSRFRPDLVHGRPRS